MTTDNILTATIAFVVIFLLTAYRVGGKRWCDVMLQLQYARQCYHSAVVNVFFICIQLHVCDEEEQYNNDSHNIGLHITLSQ